MAPLFISCEYENNRDQIQHVIYRFIISIHGGLLESVFMQNTSLDLKLSPAWENLNFPEVRVVLFYFRKVVFTYFLIRRLVNFNAGLSYVSLVEGLIY